MPEHSATISWTQTGRKLIRIALPAVVSTSMLLVAACGNGSGGGDDPSLTTPGALLQPVAGIGDSRDCSVPTLNQWVDNNMRDFYLFADQVPVVNLADYNSPESLIIDLRVLPFDNFSSVTNTTSSMQFFDEGVSFGIGFFWRFDRDTLPRILDVQDNAPAAAAGLERGDIIVSAGDVPWQQVSSSVFEEIFGTRENPREATMTLIRARTGETYSADVTPANYLINTVLHSEVLEPEGYAGSIGYLAFRSFLETSEAELRSAFQAFSAAGVTDLVVDLRYNGGGRTRIARLLAAQIGSPSTDGNLLIQYRYNDRYTSRNFTRIFENEVDGLDMSRVTFLTTGGTASSSEIVINSLRPYLDVALVGTRTTGKPFISSGRDLCGKRINAMEAEGFNANDVSVFGGIPADCFAEDDFTRPLGTSEAGVEGMLQSAIDYLVDGACNADPASNAFADQRTLFSPSTAQVMHENGKPVQQLAEEPDLP